MIAYTRQGHAVIVGDTHLSKWSLEQGEVRALNDGTCLFNRTHMKPGDVVIDAGAAIGDHTMVYLETVGQTGRVIAFEPNPEYFACLSHNCPQAVCYNAGLWSENTTQGLEIKEGNMGASHMGSNIGIPVKTMTIDSLCLDRIDFIKIDCEGAEFHILKGAEATIRAFRPKIQLELGESFLARFGHVRSEVMNWLRNIGYNVEMLPGSNTEDLFMEVFAS